MIVRNRQEPNSFSAGPAVILVVEDDVLIRMTVAADLVAAGYSVIEAASAEEALSVLAGGLAVDLVFSDIQMPGVLDGLDLAMTVRQRFPGIPVVLTSASAPELDGIGSEIPFIPKPYSVGSVLDIVRSQIAHGADRNGTEPAGAGQPEHPAD